MTNNWNKVQYGEFAKRRKVRVRRRPGQRVGDFITSDSNMAKHSEKKIIK